MARGVFGLEIVRILTSMSDPRTLTKLKKKRRYCIEHEVERKELCDSYKNNNTMVKEFRA